MNFAGRQSLAATAEASLAAALCVALPWHAAHVAAPFVALALLLPSWRVLVPAAGRDDAVFSPDPLSPDFTPLLRTLREMIEAAKVQGTKRRLILTPMPSHDGGFREYRLLWNPGSQTLVAEWDGGKQRNRTAAQVLLDAPMPICVGRHPVSIEVSRDRRTARALLAVERPMRPLGFLNPGCAPALVSAYYLYLAAALFAYGMASPERPMKALTLAVVAIAPILVRRLIDFAPRIVRFFSPA